MIKALFKKYNDFYYDMMSLRQFLVWVHKNKIKS